MWHQPDTKINIEFWWSLYQGPKEPRNISKVRLQKATDGLSA